MCFNASVVHLISIIKCTDAVATSKSDLKMEIIRNGKKSGGNTKQ